MKALHALASGFYKNTVFFFPYPSKKERKIIMKKILTLLLALTMLLACVPGIAEETAAPKYVFMFIGDGMGNPQVAATQYYLGTLQKDNWYITGFCQTW